MNEYIDVARFESMLINIYDEVMYY